MLTIDLLRTFKYNVIHGMLRYRNILNVLIPKYNYQFKIEIANLLRKIISIETSLTKL